MVIEKELEEEEKEEDGCDGGGVSEQRVEPNGASASY